MTVELKRIHHVAYRCKDAKQTVEFYKRVMNMDLVLAIAEDEVPSTKAPDPYMHIFLDAGNGNVLAFFELPEQPDMGRDTNTPEWVQHIAFKVKDRAELLKFKDHLEANGVAKSAIVRARAEVAEAKRAPAAAAAEVLAQLTGED